MSGDDDRRYGVGRHVRLEVLALFVGHAFWAAVLLYGIYVEPAVLKLGAYCLIGWGPVAVLMSYAEMRDRWGRDTEIVSTVLALAIAGVLAALAFYLG